MQNHLTPFSPIAIGELELPNRFFTAPLTRCRAVVRITTSDSSDNLAQLCSQLTPAN